MAPRLLPLVLLVALAVGLGSVLYAPAAAAEPAIHVVASGHTLGKIAKRYHTTIEAICRANDIQRRDRLKLGQELVIPERDDKQGDQARAWRLGRARSEPKATETAPAPPPAESSPNAPASPPAPEQAPAERNTAPPISSDGMYVMSLPGGGSVYYYEPTGPGRLTLRPVVIYLHGRGGNARADCRRWAPLVRRLGWLACPTGPVEHNAGRAWGGWPAAHQASMKSIQALRAKYGRRVQLWGNTLIGFSEGAFAAMNVGVKEPRTFNRMLILAAKDSYWGGPGLNALNVARARLRRIYLITGERDGVLEGTKKVREILRRAGVATRITTPRDLGHELALERKPELYRMALVWLDNGPPPKAAPAERTAQASP